MKTLTDRQEQVLRFIASQDVPPSLREIGSHMGIRSTNGVNDHLVALRRKGYLADSGDGKSRHLRLTDRGREFLGDPKIMQEIKRKQMTPKELRNVASGYREAANRLDEAADRLEVRP